MKVIDQHPSPMICSPQLLFEMEVCGSVAIFHKLGDFILFCFSTLHSAVPGSCGFDKPQMP
jgi:hypothetical protein